MSPVKGKIERIYKILKANLPLPEPRNLPPVEELVLTILSQNTSDRNRDLAWKRLKGKFSSMEEVAEAPLEEIESAIKPAGLYRQKARRIKEVLNILKEKFGGLRIPLKGEELYEFLLSLKGVGPKTAAVVSLFSFGEPYFPVDTHIFRVSNRIPLAKGRTRKEVQEKLNSLVPDRLKKELHLLLIELGRSFCRPKPNCSACPIREHCDFAKGFPSREGKGRKE